MDFLIQNSVSNNAYNAQAILKNTSTEHSDEIQVDNNKVKQNDVPLTQQIENIILKHNKMLQPTNTELQYSVHEKTKQIIISIINSETKEVLREIPPEKNLDAYVKMLELAGLMLDVKA